MRWFVRFTAVAAVALLIWPFLRTSVGDGYYSLSVDIRSSEIPNRVYCEAVGRPMHAEFVLESPWPTSASDGAMLAVLFRVLR